MQTVSCNRNNLPGGDVPDKFATGSLDCAALGRNHPYVFIPAQAERLQSEGIADTNQLSGTCDDQTVGPSDFRGSPFDGFLHGGSAEPFLCNVKGNDLRVNCRLEYGSCLFQLSAKLRCIDKVSVMSQSESSLDIL